MEMASPHPPLSDTTPETPQPTNPNDNSTLISAVPPTASLSLSISSLLLIPTKHKKQNQQKTNQNQKTQQQQQTLPPYTLKLKHHQKITSLPLTTSPKKLTPSPSKNKSFTPTPLQIPLFLAPRAPSDPYNGAAARRATIVWFRNDLRLHDNECLTTANNESTSILPLYCFDPRDYGKSSSGFDKTGPYRASFLLESVSDLRESLRAKGSNLIVRIGRPEVVIGELVKRVKAGAVFAHREVSSEEAKAEERVERAMKEEGVEVKYFWGSTLYHKDDLPFKLEDMPSNYGGFRERVQGLSVRESVGSLDQVRGLPIGSDLEPGEIPTLSDLGINNPTPTLAQDGKAAASASMKGGETEALQRLQKFAAECKAQPPKSKDGTNSIYGANFSCKISPWLAMGCLSPRHMFDELKKNTSRTISASNPKDGADGMNWLMFELLWRDFFRFITAKYSSAKRKVEAAAPATACTGALA